MSRVWFTSDLHLGHATVATVHRPFGSVEEHDYTIADNWRKVVSDRDTVYVLGDLALGSVNEALAIVGSLPGAKHFIAGNHDPCHPMHRKWRSMIPRFAEVFETVSPVGSVRHSGQQFLLSHFPYSDDHVDPPRYMQWRLPDHGLPLIHGHTHDSSQRLHGQEVHVGVDAWGFAPVELNTVANLLNGVS